MRATLVWLLLAMALAVPLPVRPQGSVIEVVDLAHRKAAEVLPVLQPLVEPGGSVSALGNQLVIRATPRQLAEVRKVLALVDKRPRRLLVTVSQDADLARARSGAELRGTVGGRDATVTLPGEPGGPRAAEAARAQALEARVYRSQSAAAERVGRSVQVLDGNSAFVATGASAPLPTRLTVVGPGGTRVIESTRYVDALAGFHVRPRTRGDEVTVEISASGDRFAAHDPATREGLAPPGTVDVQRLDTVVTGRLGEWIDLGGADRELLRGEEGSAWRSRDAAAGTRRWYLKVEALP
jgi:hypothetical protein